MSKSYLSPDDQLTENTTASPMESLAQELFSGNVNIPPQGLKNIEMALDIFNVQFDDMQNVMKTRGQFYYQFFDPKLVWDPENYNNTKEMNMHYYEHQTWLPILKFLE